MKMISDYVDSKNDRKQLNWKDLSKWLNIKLTGYDMSTRDIYQSCFNRLPENSTVIRDYDDNIEKFSKHVVNCIRSEEFRSNYAKLICNNYPNSKRYFFIHIPKTAGVTVSTILRKNPEWFCWDLTPGGGFSGVKEDIFIQQIAKFQRSKNKDIMLTGHVFLRQLLNEKLIRSYDQSFAVMRHPIDIFISLINYIITRIVEDPGASDSLRWSGWLLSDGVKPPLRHDDNNEKLIEEIIFSKNIQKHYRNIITQFLGDGKTFESAYENILKSNITIVDISVLNQYLYEAFHLKVGNYTANVSNKYIKDKHSLSNNCYEYIYDKLCGIDIELYNYIQQKMNEFDDKVIIPEKHLI